MHVSRDGTRQITMDKNRLVDQYIAIFYILTAFFMIKSDHQVVLLLLCPF